MPLKNGSKQSIISHNISELHHGRQYARTKVKHGVEAANKQAIAIAMSEARKSRRARGGKVHVGPIRGDMPGRTDVHEMKIADGSYVLPAETISHLGENNTEAGLKKADYFFGENGRFAPKRKLGGGLRTAKPVDCITAGGEFVVGPDIVRAIGRGNLDLGHKILDRFVMRMREDHKRTLSNLEPPARD